MSLASVLAGRVRVLSDRLEAMKLETAGQRVARWLQTHGAGVREIRTTHRDLAAQVGQRPSRALDTASGKDFAAG